MQPVFLKKSVIDMRNITFMRQIDRNMSLLQLNSLHISYYGQTKAHEPHKPWFMVQLQEKIHLQNLKEGEQRECE